METWADGLCLRPSVVLPGIREEKLGVSRLTQAFMPASLVLTVVSPARTKQKHFLLT